MQLFATCAILKPMWMKASLTLLSFILTSLWRPGVPMASTERTKIAVPQILLAKISCFNHWRRIFRARKVSCVEKRLMNESRTQTLWSPTAFCQSKCFRVFWSEAKTFRGCPRSRQSSTEVTRSLWTLHCSLQFREGSFSSLILQISNATLGFEIMISLAGSWLWRFACFFIKRVARIA